MGKLYRQYNKFCRTVRRGRRFVKKKPYTVLLIIGLIIIPLVPIQKLSDPTATVHSTAYTPLLTMIAKGESNGNYNAFYGHADNQTIRFTTYTIEQVLQWQDEYVRNGSPSNAVGKYQIIKPTLAGLVRQLKINPKTTIYDEATQDRLAITLLERRGSVAYVEDKISREQFAANLAKEWAALPRTIGTNPHESYYAGDGLNHSRISLDEVFDALGLLKFHATAL